MQINHFENCGKCHGVHLNEVNCNGNLFQNWNNMSNIDLTKSSGSIIDYTNLSSTSSIGEELIKNNLIFKFISNDPKNNIKLFCSLIKTNDKCYSLYYKFERDGYTSKEILRSNIFYYDLLDYLNLDMFEFKINFEQKYEELYNTCLKIRNGKI